MHYKYYSIYILCIFSIIFYGCNSNNLSKKSPKAIKGILDLKDWDFEKDGIVNLNGEWEFYWGQFLEQNNFDKKNLPQHPVFIKVPGLWNDFKDDGLKKTGDGYSTYRLKILFDNKKQILALRAKEILTACSIFVNGEKICSSGIVGKSYETMIPKVVPLMATFIYEKNCIDIIIQVSNFIHRKGGIWDTVQLGTEKDIRLDWSKNQNIELFLFGIFFIMSLYHLGLFILRTKDKSPLYFGIFCFIMSIRILTTGEIYFLSLYPDATYDLCLSIEYLTFYLGTTFLFKFFSSIFINEIPKPIVNIIMSLGIIFSIIVITTPAKIFLATLQTYQIITVVLGLYSAYVLVVSLIRKREGALIYLISFLIFFAAAINDILFTNEIIHTCFITPFGFFIFIFAQAFIISLKFSKAFSTVETQSKQLEISKDIAEAANKVKTRFLASMSHEFKTPMNHIIGMTNLLLESVLNEDQKDNANTIQNASYSMMSMINDILDYSKIEQGKLNIEITEFDIRIMIETINKKINEECRKKGLKFTCIIHHEVPICVAGDPARIKQILINLVNNGIKFTDKGEILIKINLIEEAEEKLKLRFSVIDNGIGISAEQINQIFLPFSQADSSDSRKYQGIGLGLSLSKQLIELMGSKIEVKSEVGKGSVFSFNMELNKIKKGKNDLTSELTRIDGKKILIADSSENNRLKVKELLKLWDCRFDEAANAEEAVEILQNASKSSDPFQLIIIDMDLLPVDGESLGKTIKSNPVLSNLIMIIISGFGKRGDANHLREIGFSGYLSQPIQYLELHDCLKKALSESFNPSNEFITRYSLKENKKQEIKILIAEDNIVNQKMTLKFLEKLGYKADAVINGKQAVTAMEENIYDLILMDIMMPEMDGLQATRIIRDNSSKVKRHDVVIIALTAHAKEEECIEVGMDGYLAKPIKKDDLRNAIEKFLFETEDVNIKYF